jgi:hypothetical protein
MYIYILFEFIHYLGPSVKNSQKLNKPHSAADALCRAAANDLVTSDL